MAEKWRLALDERKSIGIIFIDFQKAFDRVSHQSLPQKLQATGLCGDSFNWIANYLNNCHQFVYQWYEFWENEINFWRAPRFLVGPKTFQHLYKWPAFATWLKVRNVCWRLHCLYYWNSIDSISTQIQELLHQPLTWSKFNSMFIYPVKSRVILISKTPFIGPMRLITFVSWRILEANNEKQIDTCVYQEHVSNSLFHFLT